MSYEVDVRKLDLFNRMAKEGSSTVADHLNQLTGLDAAVETSQINFLDVGDVKTHLGDDRTVGIYVELTDAPGGYVLFVLDPADANHLVGQMMGGASEGDEFSPMEESALQEIGNILTSGFIDGWANVLDATIDMTTPTLVVDSTPVVVDEMGGWPDSDLVFVVDSHVVCEGSDLDLSVYTFPQLEDLVEMIQAIDLETDVKADTTADGYLST